jgi:hypothetical protein
VACPTGLDSRKYLRSCSGHGRCMSLANINANPDYKTYFTSSVYDDWDADRVMGCVCDAGWKGVDCSERSCMKGDDPLTTGQVEEVQYVDCTVTTSAGGLRFNLYGQTTREVPYDATADLIEYYLEVCE